MYFLGSEWFPLTVMKVEPFKFLLKLKTSKWISSGSHPESLQGNERQVCWEQRTDEGEKAEYQSPGKGHTRGLPWELSDLLNRMGLVLIRGLGDVSQMNHNPEEWKEREGQQTNTEHRWVERRRHLYPTGSLIARLSADIRSASSQQGTWAALTRGRCTDEPCSSLVSCSSGILILLLKWLIFQILERIPKYLCPVNLLNPQN